MRSVLHLLFLSIAVSTFGCSLEPVPSRSFTGSDLPVQANSTTASEQQILTSELEKKYYDSLSDAGSVDEIERRLTVLGFRVIGVFSTPAESMRLIFAEATTAAVGTDVFRVRTRICVMCSENSIDVLVKQILLENYPAG